MASMPFFHCPFGPMVNPGLKGFSGIVLIGAGTSFRAMRQPRVTQR